MNEEFAVVDTPNTKRGNRGKWTRVVNRLKELPAGKAISVPLDGKERTAACAALWGTAKRLGVTLASTKVEDSLVVWIKETN